MSSKTSQRLCGGVAFRKSARGFYADNLLFFLRFFFFRDDRSCRQRLVFFPKVPKRLERRRFGFYHN